MGNRAQWLELRNRPNMESGLFISEIQEGCLRVCTGAVSISDLPLYPAQPGNQPIFIMTGDLKVIPGKIGTRDVLTSRWLGIARAGRWPDKAAVGGRSSASKPIWPQYGHW